MNVKRLGGAAKRCRDSGRMARASEIIVILLYAVIAAAAAVAFERFGLMTSDIAWLMGAVVFLIAGQAHSAAARALERARMARALHEQKAANLSLSEEIEMLEARIEILERAERPKEGAEERVVARVLERLAAQAPAAPAARHDEADPLAYAFSDAPDGKETEAERARRRARAVEAVEANRIDLYLQPVVTLPQRRTAFYEALTRLRDADGALIEPPDFLDVVEEAGLMGEVDALLVLRCTRILRRLAKADRRSALFCNLSPRAIDDEAGFPDFMEFLKRNTDLAGTLIFEMSQADFEARTSLAARNMARMADLGFRFSVDAIDQLDLDLAEFQQSGVRFAKVEVGRFIRAAHGGEAIGGREPGAIRPEDTAGLFARYGVDLIVEHVESEAEVVEVLDLDVAYGQGYLFGAPRPVREDLLNGRAEMAAAAPGDARRAAG